MVWENVRDERLLAEARAEIWTSCDGNPPPILDPFAGGGTIPLEAQRLGLEAHASDLNPVAVLINKALIEIPPKFRDRPPVFPGLAESEVRTRKGAEGLAADARAYGAWMRGEAEKRIGHLYPKAKLPDGSEATVIAWIWARTVTCPNPACGIEMPLVRSWWLGKKGKEAYVVPSVVGDPTHPSGLRVKFDIGHDKAGPGSDGTMSGRRGAICVACDAAVATSHIKSEGVAGRMGAALVAIAAEGDRQRIYLRPAAEHREAAAYIAQPHDVPNQELGHDPLALREAKAAGIVEGERLELGGVGAAAYADAVATCLEPAISRLADYGSTVSTWMPDPKNEGLHNTFARQAIPITWDFAGANPFSDSSGNFHFMLRGVLRVVERLDGVRSVVARQEDALERERQGLNDRAAPKGAGLDHRRGIGDRDDDLRWQRAVPASADRSHEHGQSSTASGVDRLVRGRPFSAVSSDPGFDDPDCAAWRDS